MKYNYHNVFKALEKLTMKVRDGKSHLTMNVGAGRRPTAPQGVMLNYREIKRLLLIKKVIHIWEDVNDN